MKEIYKEIPLIKNTEDHRFEITIGDHQSYIEYRESGDKITLIHTETDPEIEGKGAGSAVVEKTLVYIEQNHFKLIPLCSFVVTYVQRHPEWKRIVADGVKNLSA